MHGVDQVLEFEMQFVFALDLQPQFVHYRDEQRYNVCNALARVALVVFDGNGAILLDPFEGRGTVQAELLNERVDGGKLIALHLLECDLVLDEELGAGCRVFLWRNAIPNVRFFEILQSVGLDLL